MKRGIVTVLLAALLAGSLTGALIFHGKTARLREENEAAVAQAQQLLDQAKAAYDALDPNSAQGAERRLEEQNAALADAQAQIQELQGEIQQLEEALGQAESQAETLEAEGDTAYYIAAYNALQEGMAKVEDYIEGN